MTQEQIDALEKLIQYNWEDEEADWEECGRPENHIFTTIKVLNDYLADMKEVDVRSLTPREPDKGGSRAEN